MTCRGPAGGRYALGAAATAAAGPARRCTLRSSRGGRLLLLVAALAAMASAPAPAAAQQGKAALVVGAGVAGLKAAADLAAAGYNVTVLEGRDRIGGRVWTLQTAGGPIEMGAQWIHGSNNPIRKLARKQRWKVVKSTYNSASTYWAVNSTAADPVTDKEDRSWDRLFGQLEDYIAGQQDSASDARTLQWGIDRWLAGQTLTPRQLGGVSLKVDSTWTQEYAASPPNLSLNWFDNDDALPGTDTILTGGYSQLTDYLAGLLTASGGRVILNKTVTAVTTTANSVTITAGGATYTGAFAVITLPVGVLKAGGVSFTPSLSPAKTSAINRLIMGTLNKITMQFPESSAWDNVNWVERVPLPADQGRWREYFSLRRITKRPVMVAFNAGDPAVYSNGLTDQALITQAVATMRAMFGASNIPDPTQTWVTRWNDDPFSWGSYSAVGPNSDGTERQKLGAPVGSVLYWAGEATSVKWPSTVQGAYQSGEDAAAAAMKANPLP